MIPFGVLVCSPVQHTSEHTLYNFVKMLRMLLPEDADVAIKTSSAYFSFTTHIYWRVRHSSGPNSVTSSTHSTFSDLNAIVLSSRRVVVLLWATLETSLEGRCACSGRLALAVMEQDVAVRR
jgi:hypothetical protein